MKRWRHALMFALAAGPLSAAAATHTLGLDLAEASTSGFSCPSAETCKLDEDGYRVYYEFAPTANIGLRVTHVLLNDLRLTNEADDFFNRPSITSTIHDLSVTVSFPLGEHAALRSRIGLAYWEEYRSFGFLAADTSDGVSPVVGIGVDFGGRRVRAGLFADLYPSVGDTDYVACYGVGVRFVFGSPSSPAQ